MRNFDKRLEELREDLQKKYDAKDRQGVLGASRRLDQLIAMQQRENLIMAQKGKKE